MELTRSFRHDLREGILIGALALPFCFVLGFVFPALHHPVGMAVAPFMVALVWIYRPQQRIPRYLALVFLGVLLFLIPLLISPSFLVRLLP